MRQRDNQGHVCHAGGFELYRIGVTTEEFQQVTDVIRTAFWKNSTLMC